MIHNFLVTLDVTKSYTIITLSFVPPSTILYNESLTADGKIIFTETEQIKILIA